MHLIRLLAGLQGLHQRLLKGNPIWVHNIDCVVAGLLVDELMKAQFETQTAPPPAASAQAGEST